MTKELAENKENKILIELNDNSARELKSETLLLLKNINKTIENISCFDSKNYFNNSFVDEVNKILDEYESVRDLCLSSLNEITSTKRDELLKKYKKICSTKKKGSDVKKAMTLELNKESMYVSSLQTRFYFLYEYLDERIIKADRLLKSENKHSMSKISSLKKCLLEMFSLSIFDYGLKRLVNDIISYRVQDINGMFVLTLK